MKLTLSREVMTNEYTLGSLFLNGARFGYTCEDRDRKLEDVPGAKIKGQTAIPRGTYQLKATLSARFKKTLPILLNVPGFEGVRIHAGNSASDSEGCPLLGEIRTADGVRKCADVVSRLTEMLLDAESRGEECWIEIK